MTKVEMPKTPCQNNKRRILRRVLMIIFLPTACLIIVFAGLLLYRATRPDIPPFDDSALAMNVPKVPDNLNSFTIISSVAGSINNKEIAAKITSIKDKRNPTDADIKALQSAYGQKISEIEKALNLPNFIAPLHKITDRQPAWFLPQCRNIAIVESLFAWNDFKNSRPDDAMRRIRIVKILGNRLLTANGNIIYLMISEAILTGLVEELNAIADAGVLKPDMLSELIHDTDMLDKQRTGMKQAARNEYWLMKDTFLNFKEVTSEYDQPIDHSSIWNDIYLRISFRKYKSLRLMYVFYKTMDDSAGGLYRDNLIIYNRMDKDRNSTLDIMPGRSLMNKLFNENSTGESLVVIGSPDIWKAIEKQSYFEARISTIRLKLAIYSFAAANGKPPQQLSELVPKYIDVVPRDPFDGSPMRYNAAKGIIYSVGADGKDDGGTANIPILGAAGKSDVDKEKDLVLYLNFGKHQSK